MQLFLVTEWEGTHDDYIESAKVVRSTKEAAIEYAKGLCGKTATVEDCADPEHHNMVVRVTDRHGAHGAYIHEFTLDK